MSSRDSCVALFLVSMILTKWDSWLVFFPLYFYLYDFFYLSQLAVLVTSASSQSPPPTSETAIILLAGMKINYIFSCLVFPAQYKCIDDDPWTPIFSTSAGLNPNAFTIENCVLACSNLKFTWAGIQASTQSKYCLCSSATARIGNTLTIKHLKFKIVDFI